MINDQNKKVKLFVFVIFALSCNSRTVAKTNLPHEVHPSSCCQIIKVDSTGPLAQYFPEHLGSFKHLKGTKNVYKHLTNPHSFIYFATFSKGKKLKFTVEWTRIHFECSLASLLKIETLELLSNNDNP